MRKGLVALGVGLALASSASRPDGALERCETSSQPIGALN
jgi:hypothetical protein